MSCMISEGKVMANEYGQMSEKIESLFDAIAHGDEDHREWLKEAIYCHFEGAKVPEPRGLGSKESALTAELDHLKAENERLRKLPTCFHRAP